MYLIFRKDTGQIERLLNVSPEDLPENVREGEDVLPVESMVDDAACYVNDGSLVERPTIASKTTYTIAADDTDRVSFQVPSGTIAHFEGNTHELDGMFEFSSPVPGEWSILLVPPFPYKETLIKVVADAAQA